MSFTEEDVRIAVRHGSAWFDENHPGWAGKIDLSMLYMDSCDNCIIGQAVGYYYDAVAIATWELDEEDAEIWAAEHGFCAALNLVADFPAEQKYYRALEVIWAEEVKKRLII